MPDYPIRLSIPASLKKLKLPPSILREYATRIEDFLNAGSQAKPESGFDYFEIADKLGIDKEVIKRFLAPIGGGSNGITIINRSLLA